MELLGMSRFWDMFAECAVVKRGEFGVIGGGKQPRTETRLRLRAGIQPVIEFIDATDNTDRWVQTSESSCSSNLWHKIWEFEILAHRRLCYTGGNTAD
jgi:hypothetical protein